MPSRVQHRPRTLVLGTDLTASSQNALKRALHIAEAHGATIHVVHATRRLPRALSREFGIADDRNQRDALDAVIEQIRAAGVRAHAHVAQGNPVQVLTVKARAVAADLVVVGARGRTFPDAMIGSTAERIIAVDRHRVLLVRRPVKSDYREVVIAAHEDSRLKEQVVAACLLSTRPPSVLHGYEGAFESTLRLNDVSPAELRQYRESVRREAAQRMSERVERAGLDPAGLVLRHGNAVALLQRIHPDALLVLSRSRSSVGRFLLGSVTRAVVAYGTSDVLLV